MIAHNIALVRKKISKETMGLDIKTRLMRDEMAMTFVQLAHESIRKSGDAKPDGPPVNRTGNLRRSIKPMKFRLGFGSYGAIVGPTVIYGRILELGFPNGNKYPYMKPAFKEFEEVSHAIIHKYFSH